MAQDTGGGGGSKVGGNVGDVYNPPPKGPHKPGDPPQQLPPEQGVTKLSIADIAFLYQFLQAAGFNPGTPSTAWTPELGEALKGWQQQRGIEPTGTYDVATRHEVSSILGSLAKTTAKPVAGSPPATGQAPQEEPVSAPEAPASPAAPVAEPALTDSEIADQVRRDYPHLAFLMDNPEIGGILTQAVREGWDPAETQAKILGTNWWQSRSDTARQWETELATDKTTAQRRLAVELGRLDRTLSQLNLTLDNQTKWDIADSIIRYGLSEEEVNSIVYGKLRESLSPQPIVAYGQSKAGDEEAVAQGRDAVRARVKRIFLNRGVRMQSHNETADQRIERITGEILDGKRSFDDIRRSVDYQSGALTGGSAKGVSNRLHAIASEYLVPMTERDLDEWAIRLLEGSATEDGFRARLQELATSRFPWLKGQLDAGETVASIFGSHKAVIAETLGMAPEQVDLFNNPRFAHITDFYDGKNQQRRSMTLAETKQWARDQEEFRFGREANERGADLLEVIGKTWGKVA